MLCYGGSVMSAAHIPQADSLATLRAFVGYVAERGTTLAITAGQAAGLSPRHASYYRDAAECLGLVQQAADEIEVTDAARRLLATPADSPAEGRMWRRLINSSRAIARIAPDLLGEEPPSREAIARAIANEVGLSDSVAERRAACLRRWRKQVIEREHPQLALPF